VFCPTAVNVKEAGGSPDPATFFWKGYALYSYALGPLPWDSVNALNSDWIFVSLCLPASGGPNPKHLRLCDDVKNWHSY
jgi:hypothetical protein